MVQNIALLIHGVSASASWLAYDPIRGFSCPLRTLSLGNCTKRTKRTEIGSPITFTLASAAKKKKKLNCHTQRRDLYGKRGREREKWR